MGKTRHIFKDFQIKKYDHFYEIKFDDDIGESICYSHASLLQSIFEQINFHIPVIDEYGNLNENITKDFIKSKLIRPGEITNACIILLSNKEKYIEPFDNSEKYIEESIKFIMDKSNQGYYIIFEKD